MAECSHNTDPLKLVREGTAQDERSPAALDPPYAPVNERGLPHNMVFAQGYAGLLNYFDSTNNVSGDWTPFFSSDVSVLLAVPAIEDINGYKTRVQEWFAFLNEFENQSKDAFLKLNFGYLYASIASLAQRLEELNQSLPDTLALKGSLQNLIQTQLAPAFRSLIAYFKAGDAAGLINDTAPDIAILRRPAVTFNSVTTNGLSGDWSDGAAWATYFAGISPDSSVYGSGSTPFEKINHCSTHTFFKAIFVQFLKVFAGVVGGAKNALNDSITGDDTHEPHYALFLAFLKLREYARASGNTLTQRHLDFYYRTILGLKERGSQPGHVHLLAELAKQVFSREFKTGETFRAGKDDQGKDVFFANERDFVANQAKVGALRTLYRHDGSDSNQGRLFASPLANSDDGLGAPLTSPDGSWHPFFNKIFTDGELTGIQMPKAEVGFAIASHYLLMAGGDRKITAYIGVNGYTGPTTDLKNDVQCLLTTEKGWLEIQADDFVYNGANQFQLGLHIDGGQPPIVPYVTKTHGYNFETDQPMLLVKLKQDDSRLYQYTIFQDVVITGVALWAEVGSLRTLAASNDFGPVDTSKPFLPFGASPVAGSSLIVGSKEIFQKKMAELKIDLGSWMSAPTVYPKTNNPPNVILEVLTAGQWRPTSDSPVQVTSTTYEITNESDLDQTVQDGPDYSANAFYGTDSRNGYVCLRLTGDFGQTGYQADLISWLRKDQNATDPGPKPPGGPMAMSLSASYAAHLNLVLNSKDPTSFEERPGQFFHLAPFGTAEQHPYLQGGGSIFLFPQFKFERNKTTLQSQAEFYIGISGLVPPQNVSLLFEVADGTANPLAPKPHPHIDWSYLRKNQWVEFQTNDVQDGTDELLNSGIIVLAVPREATNDDTLMNTGLYWIRAAVHEQTDAVCRLLLVAAQATQAVFTDRGNSPAFPATPLPAGTITKLEVPDAAIKSIKQPYPSFGGRGTEQSQAFYTRICERLRHKDRAISLWDYERLILQDFPEIYRVKCLNHTWYEPSETGGTYRELAPGHVTIVTIPNLQAQQQRDPLKPYTSLGTLDEITKFLEARTSCFAQLHVKNPQFEQVRLRFSVRLYDGFDGTYYTKQLQQAITSFLSPWAFSPNAGAPTFGGKVYKSVLINFVEEQPYVDYVTNFQVFQDIGGIPGTVDLDEVDGSMAVSVLVSAPGSKHEITVIDPEQATALGESCACGA
jgi:hypothetical protein